MSFGPDRVTAPPAPETIAEIIKLVPGANYDAVTMPIARVIAHIEFAGVRTLKVYRLSEALHDAQLVAQSTTGAATGAATDRVDLPTLA